MKALVGAFNQEKALVGAFSVIVKTGCGTDGALHSTNSSASTSPDSGGLSLGEFRLLSSLGDHEDTDSDREYLLKKRIL